MIEIRVHYDGPDLAEVAELTGLASQEVIAAHTGTPGASPSAASRPGSRTSLGRPTAAVPRRSEPRTSVPAGAVGLAGEFSAIYPRSSPGGWQLIGHTDVGRLRRRPGSTRADAARRRWCASSTPPEPAMGTDRALRGAGHGTARPGPGPRPRRVSRRSASARSGAADRGAFRLGARLLAQQYTAAALEVTFGGLSVRARGDVMLALTGAPAPATVDDRGVGYCRTVHLADGQILTLGAPRGRASHVRVGPRWGQRPAGPGVAGDRHAVRSGTRAAPGRRPRCPSGRRRPTFPTSTRPRRQRCAARLSLLRALRGPARRLARRPGCAGLATQWTASSRSDRVGMRLVGEPLQHHVSRQGQELPSEGVVRGSIQVPPGGEPVVFLADHPVTGGYPVVAVLVDEAMDQAAQAVPGQQIRIVLVGPSP